MRYVEAYINSPPNLGISPNGSATLFAASYAAVAPKYPPISITKIPAIAENPAIWTVKGGGEYSFIHLIKLFAALSNLNPRKTRNAPAITPKAGIAKSKRFINAKIPNTMKRIPGKPKIVRE